VDTREFGGKASAEGVHMPKKTGLRYPEEFKAEAVQLARYFPEKSLRQLAYELGVADQTLRNWIKQAEINRGYLPLSALNGPNGPIGPKSAKKAS